MPTAPPPETLGAYREMLRPEPNSGGKWRTIKRGAVGLALFGLAGWVWRNSRPEAAANDSSDGVNSERKR